MHKFKMVLHFKKFVYSPTFTCHYYIELYLLGSFNHSVYLVETSEGPLQFHCLPQWPELDPRHRQQWQLH